MVAFQKWGLLFVRGITIHKFEAYYNRDHRECPKKQIRVKQYLWLLLEQLLVVEKFADVRWWQFIPLDQVVIPVEDKIKQLLRQNKASAKEKNWRVKMLIATFCEVDAANERKKHGVEKYTSTYIDTMQRCLSLMVLITQAAVLNKTESQKVAITAKDKIQVQPCHVMPHELVDYQVQELAALKDEKQTRLIKPIGQRFTIVNHASDHKLSHYKHLDTDPNFLNVEPNWALILIVVIFGNFGIKFFVCWGHICRWLWCV